MQKPIESDHLRTIFNITSKWSTEALMKYLCCIASCIESFDMAKHSTTGLKPFNPIWYAMAFYEYRYSVYPVCILNTLLWFTFKTFEGISFACLTKLAGLLGDPDNSHFKK